MVGHGREEASRRPPRRVNGMETSAVRMIGLQEAQMDVAKLTPDLEFRL